MALVASSTCLELDSTCISDNRQLELGPPEVGLWKYRDAHLEHCRTLLKFIPSFPSGLL
jgi:hypothetical protein